MNLAEIARELGVALNTVKAWIFVLQANYQIVIMRSYFVSKGKRLVKTPKVYFTDVGTLCYLAGLKDSVHAASGPLGNAIFETAVLSEITRTLTHRGVQPRIHFWRTMAGTEVDFIVESEGKLIPIDVNLSATPRQSIAKSIRLVRTDLGDSAIPGILVYPGDTQLQLGSGVTAIPYASL